MADAGGPKGGAGVDSFEGEGRKDDAEAEKTIPVGGVPEKKRGEDFGEKARNFWQEKNEENRSASAGADAFFHQELYGGDEVVFSEDEWQDLSEEWSVSLVGFIFGARHSLGKITGFVRSRWGDAGFVSVAQLDQGIFMFSFKSEMDRDKIIDKGPWTFDNRPFVLKHWSPDEFYSLDSVESIPVWVRFPRLGVHLRRIDALSKIASLVGRPIRTDGFTNGRTKLMYARVLVEVSASRDLKHCINIVGPRGVSFVQKVEYDWIPPRCKHCQSFGHTEKTCKLPNFVMEVEDEGVDRVVIEPVEGRAEDKVKEEEVVGSR